MSHDICTFCGGNYEYKNGTWVCAYCRRPMPEEYVNEEKSLLYQAGQKLRLQDFDEAETLFSDIIQRFPKNPDAYWGLVCAKYGIKYENDYDGKKIPTCCLDTIPSFIEDSDFMKATFFASDERKKWYIEQSKYIERVAEQWKKEAQKEKPYDIFICYKDSDKEKNVERTQDSIDATDLYVRLQKKGYRVFFSRISLLDKTGEKYEPFIFNALQTAKVMIVYASKADYVSSTWLKNEWQRFLKRMETGEKKKNALVVACNGFAPSELPSVLARKQCLRFDRNDFYQLLFDYLEQFFTNSPRDEEEVSAAEEKQKDADPTAPFTRENTVLSFGQYPQSKVTDKKTIAVLTKLAGVLPDKKDGVFSRWFSKKPTNDQWKSYYYYNNSENDVPFMWYQDVEYNGEKYRGVYFSSYRPKSCQKNIVVNNSGQDENGYEPEKVYWFRFEPIRWRIVKENNGYAILLSESILDSQHFDFKSRSCYSNVYAKSDIRTWLNETFYETAFTRTQQSHIHTVTFDNGTLPKTEDKIWLFNDRDVIDREYGFNPDPAESDMARRKKTTDYAQSQGAYTDLNNYKGNGFWWLRSPHPDYYDFVWLVNELGRSTVRHAPTYYTIYGVVPALIIRFS